MSSASASASASSNGRSDSDSFLQQTTKKSSSSETKKSLRYEPRSLTEEEIDDIVSVIEEVPSAVPSSGKHTQEEIKNVLRRQLETIELVPQAIPEMKQTIQYQFRRSLVEPQTPVGFLVSEALSAPITQMTLNSVIGETEIVICDKETQKAKAVQIGTWIDELLQQNKEKIVNIPENRTEYLELEKSVLIPSTTCEGKSEWMELTAVTRHLPVGDLVKIKTRSGREMTATSQKSFLVYSEAEDKLVDKNGNDLKIGDYVGVHLELENDHVVLEDKNNQLSTIAFEHLRKGQFTEILEDRISSSRADHYRKWGDIMLDPIVSIESVPSENRNVYDVTVPQSLNFNLFNGICCRDTFHSSGSSKNMSSGIDALKELFNISEERKNYSMNIHFQTCDLDYDSIFDLRTKIVEVTLGSLIKKYEMIPHSTAPPPWTNGYLKLTNQSLPKKYDWSCRLFLDVDRMLAFQISMARILKMIRDKAPPQIIIVPSPINLGMLDMYIDETQIENKGFEQNSTLIFMSVSVLPIIQKFVLSGVEGINALFPTSIPVLSVILEEIPVAKGSDEFYLSFSQFKIKNTGLGYFELKKLFDLFDIEILPDVTDSGMFVKMPKDALDEKGNYKAPSKYVNELLAKEQKQMDDLEHEMKEEKQVRGFVAPSSERMKASKCWYAETNGKNFLEVIKLPEVDPYYTYSNDLREVAALMGIEATRNLLVMELKNVLLTEEYINPRHIHLLADVMTNMGRLTPISFFGLRPDQAALSAATFQQSMKIFTQASAFGRMDNVDAVSSSVMLGQKAKIGTGFVTIIDNKNKIPPQPDVSEFTDTLDAGYDDLILQDNPNKELEQIDQSIENNQAYMDVMFHANESDIYTGQKSKGQKSEGQKSEGQKSEGKQPRDIVLPPVIPSEEPVSVAPPKLISPNLMQVASNLTNIPVFAENVQEKKVVSEPETTSLAKSPVGRNERLVEKETIVIQPEKVGPPIPPSLPKKDPKKSMADLKNRLKAKSSVPSPTKKQEAVDVEKSIEVLKEF